MDVSTVADSFFMAGVKEDEAEEVQDMAWQFIQDHRSVQ